MTFRKNHATVLEQPAHTKGAAFTATAPSVRHDSSAKLAKTDA
jgi:hypothetical protein